MNPTLIIILLYAILACNSPNQKTNDTPNMEHSEEQTQESEWTILFDGTDLSHFRNFGSQDLAYWKISDNGSLYFMADSVPKSDRENDLHYDIITRDVYNNFELELEWKISKCGNSGIMHHVIDDGTYDFPWQTGPEMQVLDNECHPDATIPMHRAGDLYDMISCSKETVKPAGQWNQVRIISNQGHTEYWLNGTKVVEFTMWDDSWKERIANSKFKEMENFGQYKEGGIVLQDHNDPVWYRNIRIKKL